MDQWWMRCGLDRDGPPSSCSSSFWYQRRSWSSVEIFIIMWQKWYADEAVRRRRSEQACGLRGSADSAALLCCRHESLRLFLWNTFMDHVSFLLGVTHSSLKGHEGGSAKQCRLTGCQHTWNTHNSSFFSVHVFPLQCLSFRSGRCSCPQPRSKRATSTNSSRRDRSCCPALLLRSATSGWRVRRWPMPKAPTGRSVLTWWFHPSQLRFNF